MVINAKPVQEETDPILREIWDLGYTKVIVDVPSQEYLLINGDSVKRISRQTMHKFARSLKFKQGTLPDGTTHTWVQENDGSSEMLRSLLKL